MAKIAKNRNPKYIKTKIGIPKYTKAKNRIPILAVYSFAFDLCQLVFGIVTESRILNCKYSFSNKYTNM